MEEASLAWMVWKGLSEELSYESETRIMRMRKPDDVEKEHFKSTEQ